jgi:hypothetical protein
VPSPPSGPRLEPAGPGIRESDGHSTDDVSTVVPYTIGGHPPRAP